MNERREVPDLRPLRTVRWLALSLLLVPCGGTEAQAARGSSLVPMELVGRYHSRNDAGDDACLIVTANAVEFVSIAASRGDGIERGCAFRASVARREGSRLVIEELGEEYLLQTGSTLRFDRRRAPTCAHAPAQSFAFPRSTRSRDGRGCFDG